MFRRILLLSGCALLAGVGMLSAVGDAAADTIKIGVIGPLTGPAANSGISMRQAYELAAKEVNERGGLNIDGKQLEVELIFEDSASRPEVGVSAAQKLLTRDQVDLLVGDTIASSVTLALMEVAPSFNKFMMSGQPVSIEIANRVKNDPERFAHFWKSSFNSDAYAATLHGTVDWLIEAGDFEATDQSVAFIVEDTDYGISNYEYTAPLFEEEGWTTQMETVPLGHADFYPQLSKLRGDQPDVVVSIFTSVNSGIALVKQIQEQGLEALHLAVYYPIRAEFLEGAGDAAEGLLWTPLMFDPVNNEEHKEFSDYMVENIGVPAGGDHAQGYCQMGMLLDNIEQAGSVEPEALSAAFAETDYSCVIARYVYDTEIHSPKVGAEYLPVPMAQIQGGSSFAVWPDTTATADFQPQN